jgi:hypothetical protein
MWDGEVPAHTEIGAHDACMQQSNLWSSAGRVQAQHDSGFQSLNIFAPQTMNTLTKAQSILVDFRTEVAITVYKSPANRYCYERIFHFFLDAVIRPCQTYFTLAGLQVRTDPLALRRRI